MRIEECRKCKRPFSVELTGNYPTRDREDIICPHLRHRVWDTVLVRGNFETAPLTPEQEWQYVVKKQQPS